MSRTTKTLFVVLAAAFGVGGVASLAGLPAIRDSWAKLGVSDDLGNLIGVLEVLAAIGLIVGLRRPAVGVAAATGLTALMIGAVIYHLRARDYPGLAGPLTLGLLAAAVYTTRRHPSRSVQPV